MASITSGSGLSIARSEPWTSSAPNNLLRTINTIRKRTSATPTIQTVDAVSLPFLVISKFIQADPARMRDYHLLPGELPGVDFDIGYGASFIVQKATLPAVPGKDVKERAVAVKRIRPSGAQTHESFRCVINDLLCLTHPPLENHENIVDLLGIGWEVSPADGDYRLWPYLILQYSPIGNLADFQESSKALTYQQKEKLSLDVAKALHAVHHCNIVHGDVKSENVLVFPDSGEGYVAKLSDFGFAAMNLDFAVDSSRKIGIDEERKTARVSKGTRPWSAPESGRETLWQHAFMADIYSWGLLVWRIFLNGGNPFIAFRTQFESLSKSTSVQNIQAWKEQNIPLRVAISYSQTLEFSGNNMLENAFRNSLDVEPTKRDLRVAYFPWILGPRWRQFHFSSKMELDRRTLYQPIHIYQLQMSHPRLRQQFLRDLDDLGKYSSPLVEKDAMFCPTNIASMIVAEYHICTNNLGLAYNHMVRAASRSSEQARSIVAQLEPYRGSIDASIEINSYPVELQIRAGKPTATALEWAFSAACVGSLSALHVLKRYSQHDYQAALRTVRSSRLGGITALSMWTNTDVAWSKKESRLMAAPQGVEQAMFEIHVMLGTLRIWISAGPKVGVDISALHVASARGLPQATRRLLERGANVNSQLCPCKCTPLLLASICGSLETVQELINYGADPTIQNEDNETPLHWLCSFDEDQVSSAAKLLFRDRSQLFFQANGAALESEGFNLELALAGGSPLDRAIGRQNIHAVRSLLELGAEPEANNRFGTTALGLATQLHLTEIMELLHSNIQSYKPNHDHGPNLRLFNFAINSARPIDLFKIHGDQWLDNAEKTLLMLIRFGESLYGYGGEDNFVHNTIAIGSFPMTQVLLRNGAREYIEKRDCEFGNNTALQISVEMGHQAIFMELLKNGASIQTEFMQANLRLRGMSYTPEERKDRSSFLHFCAETGSDVFFVREFIKRGLDVNQPDADWRTPLYLALKAGYFDIASELLNHGATLSEVRDGQTLLGQLAEEGFTIPKERYLWLFKQQPTHQATMLLASQRHRQSIFHVLAKDSRMIRHPLWARELLAFFLEQVIDVKLLDLQDVQLNTAVHTAAEFQNLEILKALLDAGASVNLANMNGKTPLLIARETDSSVGKDICQLLELHGARRWVDLSQVESEAESLLALWRNLGFHEQLVEWLDTALVIILQDLRRILLAVFRSDGFLLQENPWKSVTRAVWDFLYEHQAILANDARMKQFEYATGDMLRGFVDAVTLAKNGGELVIKLVKPLDRQIPRFPPGLLNDLVTTMALSPGVGQGVFHVGEFREKHKSSHNESLSPGQGQHSMSTTDTSPDPVKDATHAELKPTPASPTRKWIRLRRLDDARFIIEKHDLLRDGFNVGSDTGIMVLGDDGGDMRRLMVDSLANETVSEIIDTTDEGLIYRATSVARLKTLSTAWEEHKRSGPFIPRSSGEAPPQSRPISDQIPKVGQRTDLSIAEKKRLSELLTSKKSHSITCNDELGLLLFDTPIPEGAWIHVSLLESARMGIAFPCRYDNKGNEVKPMDEFTARFANQFHLTFTP